MRVAAAFTVIYAGFDRLAAWLGSTRGEWGLLVCAVVVAFTVCVEHQLTRAPFIQSLRALGLGAPPSRALVAGVALSAGMIACLPLLAHLTGTPLAVRDGATWLAFGMFAQGGVAEETLFRGFMYKHVRRDRTFWRAAGVSAVPFAIAHVPLFVTLPIAIAALSLGMALALSFPLAWLLDRAHGSIWPGAMVHAAIQGGVKLLVEDAATFQGLALAWIALGVPAPWLLFLLRERAPVGRR